MKRTRTDKPVLYTLETKTIAKEHRNSSLPLIYCKCGAAILALPNAKMMSKAIEQHIKTHHTKPAKGASDKEIRQHLIAQVLNVAVVQPQE